MKLRAFLWSKTDQEGKLIGPGIFTLTRRRPPYHIPFHITVQVCGRDVPQTLIDEGSSVSIFSSIAWQDLARENCLY